MRTGCGSTLPRAKPIGDRRKELPMKISRFPLIVCSALILLALQSLEAQSSGSVVGTVTDASGGSFPQGNVTLTNLETAERHSAQTDVNGNYQFVSVVPGDTGLKSGKTVL